MSSTHSRSRHAFTLTETVLALVIIGISLGAIWSIWNDISRKNKESKSYTDILMIAGNIQRLYRATGSISNISSFTNTAMINSNVVPANMINAANQMISIWGTPVTLSAPNKNHFKIAYGAIPEQDCRNFVGHLAGNLHPPTLASIKVGANTFTGNYSATNTIKILDASNPQLTNCSAPEFIFKLK